ncbi:MAG: hypothetical protein PHG02_02175 [Oscillospiraceae bacterium]|nr:hypothetical protein [Oscillospiraceae bacterium]
MGLFSKKNTECPVCGGEVKGLFLVKLNDKRELCKTCSKKVSMQKDLLKDADEAYMREHITYRDKNAERYQELDTAYEVDFCFLKVGADLEKRMLYIKHDSMKSEDNPSVFDFDEITGYKLFRLKKLVDSDQEPGETCLESTLSAISGIAQAISGKDNAASDYLLLELTTTNKYWPVISIRMEVSSENLYGMFGTGVYMEEIGQLMKGIVRKENIHWGGQMIQA